MMTHFDSTDIIVCRPALQTDTDGMLELCSHIWDGGDYIPHVWEKWLADPHGLLGVAEMCGRVVGIFKLTRFQEQEWYLEGLRVHPDVQGMGIAAHIHDYVVETWRQKGTGLIRLVTGSYNVKVHHMCEQTGFQRIAEFIPYRAPVLAGGSENFTLLKKEEASAAREFVQRNGVHAFSWGLINLGWVYADLQLKHFQEAILEDHAWWWKGKAGFLSIWEDDEDGQPEPGIKLVACLDADLTGLLLDYRGLMGSLGYSTAGWVVPNHAVVLACLEAAGFQQAWDKSLYVYELHG